MGMLDLRTETLKTNDGKTFEAGVYTSTSDLSDEKHGSIDVTFIECVDGKRSTASEYHFRICVGDYSDKWIDRLFRAFVAAPEWRETIKSGRDGYLSNTALPKLPSVSLTRASKELRSDIKKLNNKGNDKAKFKDFAALRSGRDEYSSMRHAKLCEAMKIEYPALYFPEKLTEEKDLAVWMRWVLRGLEPELALRKVLTDMEIAVNSFAQRSASK